VTGLSPVPALRSEKAPAERGDSRRAGWALDALSLGSFVALGLPDGMLGTAWPSARQTFGAPIADLGLILLISTIGAISVSAFVGPLIRRFGVAVLLACSAACAALAGTGYALAPHLWVLFAVAVLWGLAAGMMDGGLNTAVGLSGRSRLLNLLHAAYGVGTAIGPLLVTAAILLSSWRSGYLVLAVLDLVVTALWLRQRRQERAAQDAAQDAPATEPAQAGQAAAGETAAGHPSDAWSRRRSGFVVAAGMSIFFVYTGVEVAAGQWEASFCRGHLGLSASAAGLATFGFWGALTAGRLILAVLPRPVPPSRVVWWGSGIAVAAAALIWWQPGTPATLAAFVLLGGALAGVFPALIALTPLRIGRGRAQHAIAWQVGAAAGGGSGLSALIGLLIGVWGLSVLGPSLTVLAVLLVAGIILLERTAPIAQPAVAAGPVDLRIASRRRMLGAMSDLFAAPSVSRSTGREGSVLLRSAEPLGSYPASVVHWLRWWAEADARHPLVAQRSADGEWDVRSYGQVAAASAIGQALLDRGLSAERPLLILSDNSIGHLLMALGAMTAGIPNVPVSVAYSLQSSDHRRIREIAALVRPGAVYAEDAAAFKPAIVAVGGASPGPGEPLLVSSRNGPPAARSRAQAGSWRRRQLRDPRSPWSPPAAWAVPT